MREIKFRAWDGEHLLKDFLVAGAEFCNAIGVLQDEEFAKKNYHVKEWKLMQYTGLKDKNGKEIYEGDIVKYSDPLEDGIAIIEQHKHFDIIPYLVLRYIVNTPGTGDYNFDYLSGGPNHDYEVIGNIHENPELLN